MKQVFSTEISNLIILWLEVKNKTKIEYISLILASPKSSRMRMDNIFLILKARKCVELHGMPQFSAIRVLKIHDEMTWNLSDICSCTLCVANFLGKIFKLKIRKSKKKKSMQLSLKHQSVSSVKAIRKNLNSIWLTAGNSHFKKNLITNTAPTCSKSV